MALRDSIAAKLKQYTSLLTGWLPTVKADALSDIRHPSAWLVEWAQGGRVHSGVQVTQQSMMGLSTYYACVRAISEDIGRIPLIVYKNVRPRGKIKAYTHKYFELLHDFPNPEMEAMSFRETLTAHALTWGNGYAEIERDFRGDATALWPIHPSRVTVRRNENLDIVYDIVGSEMIQGTRTMQTYRLRPENVLHIRGVGPEGLYGYSILQVARESMGLSLAAQQYGAAYFGNGAHVGGVLQHPGNLSDTALTHLRESWTEAFVGPHQSGKPAILEEGMTWTAVSLPPDQSQFLETRNFQVREIARWFRMPLHKVQDLADASFNNIEHQGLDYLTDTVSPWAIRWEQQLKRKLFYDDVEHFAELYLMGLLRADQRSRSSYYRVMLSLGALSPNDIRESENMNSIGPAGDTYFIASNNLTPIEQVLNPPPEEGEMPVAVPVDPEKPLEQPLTIPTPDTRKRRNGVHT